jgi:Protein kinase domain
LCTAFATAIIGSGEEESLARAPLRNMDPPQVGRYRLTARLGAGGMGVVYLGVDPDSRDGRLVAVKVLRPELADDPEFRSRFGREVANLTRVKGVCTVRVIEADTGSAWPFMVTEYVPGPSLSEYVGSYGPPGPDMMYGLATGLAEALTAIHAAGVVHRDLKPSNVILGQDGPKVIDFGIAQALDATSVTRTGMMVGSAGFMAPEQVTGQAGQAADIFAWAVTLTYAASGQMPFGTGSVDAILYRVLHIEPDTSAVPELLRPMVDGALAKDPNRRPRADELLARLTSRTVADRGNEFNTQAVLARTWQPTEATPVAPTSGSLLLEPAPPGPGRPRHGTLVRRTATVGGPVVALLGAVLALALLTGHFPKFGHLAANQQDMTVAAAALGTYPGQEQRGVSQTVDRVVASGNTIVAMGAQTSDGVVRQQFFVSTDSGATWRVAATRAPGGGPAPLGYPAARLAGGPGGWVAIGPQAIWTSPDGLTWTLAATHGITQPGDQLLVLTDTAQGFLAAGEAAASGGAQAVIWTSKDGLTWQRKTAAQLGLTADGATAPGIVYGAAHGADTVISGGVTSGVSATWLSTDGGSTWTAVTIPADHGAGVSLSGLGSDGSGLVAVRAGQAATGGPDGVAYFSPNGQDWQYAGTIDAAGGWQPKVVKGGPGGFVVTGQTSAGQIVAYTSTGTGGIGTWQPTGSLGQAAAESVAGATVGTGGTVVAVGTTSGGKTGKQPVFVTASRAGTVRPVSLTAISGGAVPELAVNGLAAAGGEQVAVGSADGYPAVWRQAPGSGSWSLVSALPVVSAYPGLTALTSVTHGPAGWLAVGEPGPVVLTSADGTTWQAASGSIAQDLAGASGIVTAADQSGYVIVGNSAGPDAAGPELWWSPNLTSWTRGADMNDTGGSSQISAVTADAREFMAVGSHNGHPAVWTTSDGQTWTTIVLGLPPGASAAALQQVAIGAGHVVALGVQTRSGQTLPFAELSADGGASWQEDSFGSASRDTAVTALTVGPGGFTAASQSGLPGQRDAQIWTSATGSTWTSAQVTGLSGGGSHEVTGLVSSGSAVSGIGLTATQPGQQPVTVSLAGG